MNTNIGKRNKQAVQVLNKVEYDENGNPYCTSQKTERPKRKENINLLKRLPKLF